MQIVSLTIQGGLHWQMKEPVGPFPEVTGLSVLAESWILLEWGASTTLYLSNSQPVGSAKNEAEKGSKWANRLKT